MLLEILLWIWMWLCSSSHYSGVTTLALNHDQWNFGLLYPLKWKKNKTNSEHGYHDYVQQTETTKTMYSLWCMSSVTVQVCQVKMMVLLIILMKVPEAPILNFAHGHTTFHTLKWTLDGIACWCCPAQLFAQNTISLAPGRSDFAWSVFVHIQMKPAGEGGRCAFCPCSHSPGPWWSPFESPDETSVGLLQTAYRWCKHWLAAVSKQKKKTYFTTSWILVKSHNMSAIDHACQLHCTLCCIPPQLQV